MPHICHVSWPTVHFYCIMHLIYLLNDALSLITMQDIVYGEFDFKVKVGQKQHVHVISHPPPHTSVLRLSPLPYTTYIIKFISDVFAFNFNLNVCMSTWLLHISCIPSGGLFVHLTVVAVYLTDVKLNQRFGTNHRNNEKQTIYSDTVIPAFLQVVLIFFCLRQIHINRCSIACNVENALKQHLDYNVRKFNLQNRTKQCDFL